jgi:hypothetical protein
MHSNGGHLEWAGQALSIGEMIKACEIILGKCECKKIISKILQ